MADIVIGEARVMSIERLTAEDRVMLWPDDLWPQEIGALALLDGRNQLDGDGNFRIETVRDAVAARLHLAPRFRQLLVVPPPRLGGPMWVDAPAFDVADHVGVVPVPAPGEETALLAAVETLRRRRLDRSRPLWEMWFMTGLPDGRIGLLVKIHHAVADGIAGVATMSAFLDPDPNSVFAPGPPWTPAPPPPDADLLADRRRERAGEAARTLSLLTHPVSTVRHAIDAWPALRELVVEKGPPATSLDQVVGADRSLALVRSRIDLIRKVAHAYGATVNDVLLDAVAGGLRELLGRRGEPVEGTVVRAYVPVTLRQGDRARASGNDVAQMVVPLPIGIPDPLWRLRLIAAETAIRKARSRPSVGKIPQRGAFGHAYLKLITSRHVNLTTADLPGPGVPLYFAGAPVLEVFPLLPLIGAVSLGVGAISYAGQFNLMAVADRDACPDLDVFAEGVRRELKALTAATRGAGEHQLDTLALAAAATNS